MVDMEGQSRSSVGVSQLESKIQELEDRLRSEERCSENSNYCTHVDLYSRTIYLFIAVFENVFVDLCIEM